MKFTKDALPGIVDGSITLTFRGWKRAMAKAGGRHRVWGILLEIDDVSVVSAADITDDEARKAGEADAAALHRRLGDVAAGDVYRVQFRHLGEDDRVERRNADALDDDTRAALQMRLDRMDRSSAQGPWTAKTLRLIATYPGLVSTALARQLAYERPAFKINVRKLKELGLTESLEVGYRLSPRGRSFLGIAEDAPPIDAPSIDAPAIDGPDD